MSEEEELKEKSRSSDVSIHCRSSVAAQGEALVRRGRQEGGSPGKCHQPHQPPAVENMFHKHVSNDKAYREVAISSQGRDSKTTERTFF